VIKKIIINIFIFSAIWLFISPAQAEISFGNLKGNVMLIEYFSYNCPICRKYMPLINYLAKQNSNLEVIQRVVPIAIPALRVVDKAVLASFLQNKFPQFISPQEVFTLAKKVNLDIEQLLIDMKKSIIRKQLMQNLKGFAKTHQIRVPVFVIYNKNKPKKKVLMVGAQPLRKLQHAINFLTKTTNGDHYENRTKET
jgi:protein-disulfide isomerase